MKPIITELDEETGEWELSETDEAGLDEIIQSVLGEEESEEEAS